MKKIILVLLPFILLMGCVKKGEKQKTVPLVVVSVPPYIELVEKISQGKVKVVSAISPNFNPHLFEITPREMATIEKADLWIGVGEGYEALLLPTLKKGGTAIVKLQEEVDLREEARKHVCPDFAHHHPHGDHHGHMQEEKDLHFYLSPKRLKLQARLIKEALVKLTPEEELFYEKNLTDLLQEIDTLDREIAILLAPYKNSAILVSHPAFGYFCDDYSLVQIPIESEGKSPLPKELTKTVALVEKRGVRSVFIQPQFDNKGALLIAKEFQLAVHMVDPLNEKLLKNLKEIALLIAQ